MRAVDEITEFLKFLKERLITSLVFVPVLLSVSRDTPQDFALYLEYFIAILRERSEIFVINDLVIALGEVPAVGVI